MICLGTPSSRVNIGVICIEPVIIIMVPAIKMNLKQNQMHHFILFHIIHFKAYSGSITPFNFFSILLINKLLKRIIISCIGAEIHFGNLFVFTADVAVNDRACDYGVIYQGNNNCT